MPEIEFFGLSFVGRREENEDSMLTFRPTESSFFLGVADGMGRTVGGQVASRTALATCEEFLKTSLPSDPRPERLKEILAEMYDRCQRAIAQAKAEHPHLSEMGTTLVCVLGVGDKFVVGNIGDSRVYYLHRGRLSQMTVDHTYVQEYRAKIRRIPDEIDLWLMNILMEYPFTKLSREAAKEGIRQQVASYHLIRHVRPLWLYNVVRLKIDPDQVPTKVYYFGTSDNESAKRLAATLVQTPYVPVSFVEGNKVFAYTTIPTGLEMKLVRSVRAIETVEEFNEIAAMEKDLILEITRPFGRDVGGGRWIMDRFYQAVRALRVKKEEA